LKRRPVNKNNTHSRNKVNWEKRAKFARQFTTLPFNNRTTFTPEQKKAVTRAWRKFRNYRNTHHIATSNKTIRDRLKAAGFVTTDKGAFIDKPRDSDGKIIKGSRLRVSKSGIVVEKTGQRITHIIGIPAKDRKRFANDPCGYIHEHHPRYGKRLKQKGTVAALQWGAFASTKPMRSEEDICKSIFNYLHDAEGELRKERLHNLNGLRIIEHGQVKAKKKRATKKRKAKRRHR